MVKNTKEVGLFRTKGKIGCERNTGMPDLLRKKKSCAEMDQKETEAVEQNQEFYIDSDGIRLHAKLDFPDNFGDRGPLMLLFHGFTGHMEEPHIVGARDAAEDAGLAVLRVELYGHGQSEGKFEHHTLYKWITNALSVMDYVKTLDFVTDLYLCGHSQGGLLAVLLAGMRPDDFRAVIPLSPALQIPEGAREGNLLGITFDPLHIPEKLPCWDGRSLDGDYVRTAQTIHVEDEISRYHGPVCIIHGDADETVPIATSILAAEQYENAVLETIPGDTHCYDDHLDEMKKSLKEFLLKKLAKPEKIG